MCRLFCACFQVLYGSLYSDENRVPFEMLARGSRPASRKPLIQQFDVCNFIRLHQDPVGKGATAGTANLVRQQLDRAVEDAVIVWLYNAKSVVVEQPNHAGFFDGPTQHRIRLQHLQPFWRSFKDPRTDNGSYGVGYAGIQGTRCGLSADWAMLDLPTRARCSFTTLPLKFHHFAPEVPPSLTGPQ